MLWHDPRDNVDMRCRPELLAKVPKHKRLMEQPAHLGLPIGNLSSQFFANVYLDVLDQFVKHQIRAPRYVRYVDDFVLVHESPQWLNDAHARIDKFLPERLHARLNPTKTILQPVDRGIDFVGHFLKPWHRTIRPRTRRQAAARLTEIPAADVYQATNSYFGLLRQSPASHKHRAEIANIARQRGHAVSAAFTKAYRSKT